MNHLDDDVLSAYSLDETATPEVEAHLAQCEICRDGVAFYREIDGALRGRDTWTTVDQARSQNSRLQEVLAYRWRMELEERAARTFLSRALTAPLLFRNAAIPEKPQLHTEGMVRVLCTEANQRHEQSPKFSREIATVAYDVARKLTATGEREKHNLMALALREHANALRYLGKFKAALQDLDNAEKLLGGPEADPFDLAVVSLIHATVSMEMERLEDAIRLAREVASVFREYGDVKRELSAVMVAACCFVHAGKARDAADSLESAITISRANGDLRMLAHALSNCAVALRNLKEFDKAERYCVEAITLFEELEVATEKTRAEWVFAMILLARGDYLECERCLTAVRRDLTKLGLTNDATLATLMWAEARLAANRPAGVAAACRNLVASFENEDMHHHAMRALAVLNEALTSGRGTSQLVHDVRVYLERLPRHPAEPFTVTQ